MYAVRTRLELVTPCVTGMYSNQTELTHQKEMSGKRDSNSRPQPWQGCALPTELFPQTLHVWAGTDSNCRSREATDLQSARFNHLPTYPSTGLCQEVTPAGFKPTTF